MKRHVASIASIDGDTVGYPIHRLFFEFINRFGLLAPEALTGSNFDGKMVSAKILEKWGSVAFRTGQMPELDARKSEVVSGAASEFTASRKASVFLQSFCKAYIRLWVSVLAFQTCQRAIEARKRFRRRKESKATIKIQPALLFIVSAVIGFLAAHWIWNGEVKPKSFGTATPMTVMNIKLEEGIWIVASTFEF
ncbi:IQ motif, EF-hand binding site [Artemisia annua]|uniref:IQ motif, EF-hand binding site n=1 Tax=Artemisia annua TaxID=35608 RepID=A0A2U1PXS4_ARTAN|nr:IQ motif, EF-hand binding site [Artemisia annua]